MLLRRCCWYGRGLSHPFSNPVHHCYGTVLPSSSVLAVSSLHLTVERSSMTTCIHNISIWQYSPPACMALTRGTVLPFCQLEFSSLDTHTKEWHGSGNSGNTAVTAVLPREWMHFHGSTAVVGNELSGIPRPLENFSGSTTVVCAQKKCS